MKVLVINPLGTDSWNESDKKLFTFYAFPETTVDVISLDEGAESLERREDYIEALPRVVEKVVSLQKEYDGVTVNCFLDPAVDDLKTLTGLTVVGPCEASLALASTLGWWFSIVTVAGAAKRASISTRWLYGALEGRVRMLGYDHRVKSIRSIDLHVKDLLKHTEKTKSLLVEECRKALNDGAEVIILGCTGLGGLGEFVQDQLHVSVVDPVPATIKVLESLIKLKLRKKC